MAIIKHDYTDFEKLMLEKISSGCATASSLEAALLDQASLFASKQGEEFRVIDRRLQALRKRGDILCGRVGRDVIWRLTSTK